MPLATKTQATLLTPDFAKQIANNIQSPVESIETVVTETPVKPVVKTPAEKKGKYSDVVNLHFTTGKRAEFKAFFSSNEITLVQGVELAVNYIMKEVKAGNLTISRNGLEKVGE